ncbi:hypothetical protein CDAR_47331 [Caerostris darwini]|uniref:Uncharacterized protein n=1 Tax=Caerostris darwini TaxID=1538125 RepID=A0AAV4T3P3_9ARAC|nr:hypothetical protein CDAR_47331 [Caerostris darwini]
MGKKEKRYSQDFWEEIFNPIVKPSQNSVGIAPIRDIPLEAIIFHCEITHFIPVNAHEPVGWGEILWEGGKKGLPSLLELENRDSGICCKTNDSFIEVRALNKMPVI